MKQSTINLYRSPQGWMATWVGPEAEKIKRLFGTDTMPTAFTAQASATKVLEAIGKLNPECAVVVIG